jgi:endo-1,4-beta-xylanase
MGAAGRWLALAVCLVGCGGPPSSTAGPAPPAPAGPPTLRALAAARGIQLGTAVAAYHLAGDRVYARLAGAQFSSATPEDEMKWARVEPQRGRFDWSAADAVVAFARAHGQRVRGHNLVSHSEQLPGWLAAGALTAGQLDQLLRAHVATEVGRYRGRVAAWDVVNEPLDQDGSLRASIWQRAIGPGYIAEALRAARRADPGAALFLNDYDIEGVGAKSTAMLGLVRSLKAEGVPIDGVGFEGHLVVGQVPPSLRDNIARFVALGVRVEITELDVRLPLPATDAQLARQASDYGTVVADCLDVAGCTAVTVWEFSDRYSWVPAMYPGWGAADLYDQGLGPKPAYAAAALALSPARRPAIP